MKKRIRAVPGGTSAGKTISIESIYIDLAQRDSRKSPTITSIVSESVPHLKRGAMRDFKKIMKEQNYWKDSQWSVQDSTYTFETGSIIEFFSVDNGDKLRGGRRDRLFCNEANNIPFDAFEQLEMRTKEVVFLDWNPTNEFWYYTDVKPNRDDVEEITLTFRDNEALDPRIVESILQRKNRKGWWKVYGEGKLGEVEGKIYTGWKIIDEIPHEAKLLRFALDFGYTNDPSALVAIYGYNGGYIFDELLFKKGMQNIPLAEAIKNQEQPSVLTIADCSEPKSIDEIKDQDVVILPCVKGPDSIVHGIQLVQGVQCSVTKRSTNIIKEFRNYLWRVDRDGKVLNIPEGGYDHSMDAIRYGMADILREVVSDFDHEAFSKAELTGREAIYSDIGL